MVSCIRYICASDLLPIIEAMLALDGYQVELSRQQSIGGASALVMSRGSTSILLGVDPPRARGVIEIWGPQQAAAARWLESLSVDIAQHSPS